MYRLISNLYWTHLALLLSILPMQKTAKLDPSPATPSPAALLIIARCDARARRADDGKPGDGCFVSFATPDKAGANNEGVACADDEFHHADHLSLAPPSSETRFIIDAVDVARRAAPEAIIIALASHTDAAFEQRVVAAGANLCSPMHSAASQLRTLLLHTPLREPPEPQWQLFVQKRILQTPDGRPLALTASELLFLLRLADSDVYWVGGWSGGQNSAHRARRSADSTGNSNSEMFAAWHAGTAGAAASLHADATPPPASQVRSARPSRSTTVLVSRLRHKAQRQGICLPLTAIRGYGYMLLARVKQIGP